MKSEIILTSLALSRLVVSKSIFIKAIGLPILIMHRFIIEWLFCVEISWYTKIGVNLKIFHPFGIVVHRNCVIGDNCIIRQNTTIGTKTDQDGNESLAPQLGNNVDIGSGVNIIGNIVIGNNVVIGAGSVIVHDVPDDSTVVGNPGKIIRQKHYKGINK